MYKAIPAIVKSIVKGFSKQKKIHAEIEMIRKFLGNKAISRKILLLTINKIEKLNSQILKGRAQLSNCYFNVSHLNMVNDDKVMKRKIRKISIHALIVNISSHF